MTDPPSPVASEAAARPLPTSLRILLIAYACEPGRGSEPGTGWNMALGLSGIHDVTVATRANNRRVIERFLDRHDGPAPQFLYVDPPSWVLKWKALGIMPVQVFYVFWQRAVARALQRHDAPFDILHQLTFNSFEVPPLAFHGASGIKIWGPAGGGQTVPSDLRRAFGRVGGFKEALRNLRVRLSARTPWVKAVLRQCSLVLFANHETRGLLAPECSCESDMMIDVGVDVEKFRPPSREKQDGGKITLLSAGRIEGRKGVVPLLDAFERLARRCDQVELRFVGTGPMLAALRNEVTKRGLDERVVFTGAVSHDMMNREFSRADLFVFPSLRDTSGAVVLEAMAMELPVICFDHQGAALMVEDDCGIRIPASTYDAAVESLAEAMDTLAGDPEMRRRFGRNGRKAVRCKHDWSVKVARISSFYRSLAETTGSDRNEPQV